jgi:predicted nucleic acid-binding protein
VLEGYLLDTNIVSESRRLRADAGVTAFLALARSEELFISVLTLGEFRKGVEAKRRTDPVAAEQLQLWADTIETEFADRVLPVNKTVARLWGELSAARPLPAIDTLIAATAIAHGLTLVTRNTRDMESTGVRLINPWKA